MNIYDYTVIEANSIDDLRDQVKQHLELGWKVHGSVTITSYTETENYFRPEDTEEVRILYAQAMVACVEDLDIDQ